MHEYTHLVDHFSGKYLLNIGIEKRPVAVRAEYYWGVELNGFWKQWLFLKKMGFAYLFMSPESVVQYGEWEAFLRETYNNLKIYPNFSQYRPYWEKYYAEELKRPRS